MTKGRAYEHHINDVAWPKDWKRFLSCGYNKIGLAKCYTKHMQREFVAKLDEEQSVYISSAKSSSLIG